MIAGNTNGQAITLIEDSFYIKITEVSGSAHGWVRVERNTAHLWEETAEKVSATNDPAFEVNGGSGSVGQVYKAWRHPTTGEVLFFLTNRCTAPNDPGWPCSLFGFYGLIEFGYLDSTIGTINSSVVNKAEIANIQAFRIAQFTDSSGTLRQFRGASGWYFQAAASTTQTNINATVNDERDITTRSSWVDLISYWQDGLSPPAAGTGFEGIDYLFRGLTTFGGYCYGTRDTDITPGDYRYPAYNVAPGPIRLTYIYGDANTTNNCRLNFELRSACKVRLTGTTPSIPDWANSGSLMPDTEAADLSLKVGSDNFIVLDGLRAIRIRILGWTAHMADHAIKQNSQFYSGTFPGGMTMVWRHNNSAFAYDGSTPLGDYTAQYSYDANGTLVYGSSIEMSAFHHFHFGNWCNTNLGAPDRYNLTAKAKVWYTGGSLTARPDPYKVNLINGASVWTPPDEVVEAQATVRQTVHTGPTGPPFYDPPDYAENPGFIFNFAQTVDNIDWLHITYHYNSQIVGSQFFGNGTSGALGFPLAETYDNAIRFVKADSSDQVTDDYSASLIGMPFGAVAPSPLPPVYLARTTTTGLRFRNAYCKIFWNVPEPSGTTYTVDWGDGTVDTGITSLTPNHVYDTVGGDTFTATLTTSGGLSHKTTFAFT